MPNTIVHLKWCVNNVINCFLSISIFLKHTSALILVLHFTRAFKFIQMCLSSVLTYSSSPRIIVCAWLSSPFRAVSIVVDMVFFSSFLFFLLLFNFSSLKNLSKWICPIAARKKVLSTWNNIQAFQITDTKAMTISCKHCVKKREVKKTTIASKRQYTKVAQNIRFILVVCFKYFLCFMQ